MKWVIFKKLNIIFFIIVVSNVYAEEIKYHPVNELVKIVKKYASDVSVVDNGDRVNFEVVVREVPVKLPYCNVPIQPSLPSSSSANSIQSVLLTCSQTERSWQTIVPIRMNISTRIMTAARNIPAGAIIEAKDLSPAWYDKAQLYSGYYYDPQNASGLIASKVIVAGSPITAANTSKPLLVRKNEEVMLQIFIGSVRVSMKGIAKSDGRLNQTVQVYNPQSKKTVDAIVVGERRLKI